MRVMSLNDHWLPHRHSNQLCEILQVGVHTVVKPENIINHQSINQSINQCYPTLWILRRGKNTDVEPDHFSNNQSIDLSTNHSTDHIIISNQPLGSLRE